MTAEALPDPVGQEPTMFDPSRIIRLCSAVNKAAGVVLINLEQPQLGDEVTPADIAIGLVDMYVTMPHRLHKVDPLHTAAVVSDYLCGAPAIDIDVGKAFDRNSRKQ